MRKFVKSCLIFLLSFCFGYFVVGEAVLYLCRPAQTCPCSCGCEKGDTCRCGACKCACGCHPVSDCDCPIPKAE